MARRTIDVMLVVGFGNGDEGVYKVQRLSVPEFISSIKGADKKDEELEQHAEYLVGWLKDAISAKELSDERYNTFDVR